MYSKKSIVSTLCGVAVSGTSCIISGMPEIWIDRVKERMRTLGKTQESLARPLGVKTRSAIGHYFNGRRKLSAEQAVDLAKELQCSLDYLFAGKPAVDVEKAEPSLSPQQQDLLSLFNSLTEGQQRRFLAEMSQTKRCNEELYQELKRKYEGSIANSQHIACPDPERRSGEERRQNTNVVETDFRSGFDRRQDDVVIIGPGESLSDAKDRWQDKERNQEK
jgi:transcriptional regulator with XRE-family HTH domain